MPSSEGSRPRETAGMDEQPSVTARGTGEPIPNTSKPSRAIDKSSNDAHDSNNARNVRARTDVGERETAGRQDDGNRLVTEDPELNHEPTNLMHAPTPVPDKPELVAEQVGIGPKADEVDDATTVPTIGTTEAVGDDRITCKPCEEQTPISIDDTYTIVPRNTTGLVFVDINMLLAAYPMHVMPADWQSANMGGH